MIKLVVSDVDGTLVPDGSSRIDPEIFDVILELKKRGITFVVASGRQYESIHRLLEPVADDVIFIAENGGKVMRRGQMLSVEYMDPDVAKELIIFLRRLPECELMLATPDYTWLETKDEEFADWMINGYKFHLKRTDDVLPLYDQVIKIAAYRKNGVQPFIDKIKEQFQNRLNIMMSGNMWADCMGKTTDKGNALSKIQQQLGITPDETMAFGDNCNDMQMLDRAVWSYAVANAHSHLKKAARYVAPPCSENGVLRTIREQLMKEPVM
ncbi:MAG: Cof-type HAD-IIB family hydrolase [Lachnospiraceae bacterium]|nr:Cof-type HAD-IIB family hydrolase [Lachnospiraceae bacterium]